MLRFLLIGLFLPAALSFLPVLPVLPPLPFFFLLLPPVPVLVPFFPFLHSLFCVNFNYLPYLFLSVSSKHERMSLRLIPT